jgi:hypothetical protein
VGAVLHRALVAGCYLITAAGLTGVRASARALLIVVGLAGIGIAASPEPASGATPRHLAWTVLGAVTIAVWPAFAARRTSPRPLLLSAYGSAAVTAVFVALLGWLLTETRDGSVLGLAERLTSSIQTCWPFIIAVALRRTPRSLPSLAAGGLAVAGLGMLAAGWPGRLAAGRRAHPASPGHRHAPGTRAPARASSRGRPAGDRPAPGRTGCASRSLAAGHRIRAAAARRYTAIECLAGSSARARYPAPARPGRRPGSYRPGHQAPSSPRPAPVSRACGSATPAPMHCSPPCASSGSFLAASPTATCAPSSRNSSASPPGP